MKKFLAFSFFLMLAFSGFTQKTKLLVNATFTGIEEGYDHDCKTQVYINGKMVGESAVAKQSKGATFNVDVPVGKQELRIVNLALYEGNWEEHTVDNNYSIDCTYENTITFNSKPAKLYLLFDLDNGTQVSWKKPVKKKK